ncbi:MAG: helix-turn-helix domain-containing protein [Prevotellaceae bacterium]|nr:helix-turn-helix domain-containing protein [Prevotellaceae bacterium]
MNNIMALNLAVPADVAMQLAARVKNRRLELNLTQEGMALRAGIKFATYRRFEQTGEISLRGLLQIAFALDTLDDFNALFTQKRYQSLDEMLHGREVTRKRGKKHE